MERDLKVAVVGLGKMGLPFAVQCASKGASVIGCDVDAGLVADLNAGRPRLPEEPGVDAGVRASVNAGRLRATTETAKAVEASSVIVVVIPVDIDAARRPDFTILDVAAADVAAGLRPGSLVILETTVPVGTTRQRFGRALAAGSGLGPSDFKLAFSPERVSSGRVLEDLATYAKLVGGVDAASGNAAAAFYRRVLDAEVTLLADAETAEFAKLAETTYRDVNIALANELALAAEALGVDYAAAARAANSQPYSHLHTPGVGVGGHFIPLYPYFLLDASEGLRLPAVGREVNDGMAGHAVRRLEAALAGTLAGKTVLVLGLSYRGGVKEAAHSSTLLLTEELQRRGARVLVNDPLFSAAEIAAYGLEATELPPRAAVDAAVLQAAHPQYRELDLRSLAGCRVFLDGRGAFDRATVVAAGIQYLAIGLGGGSVRS
jgi:nucleotide sugar dehydrogenase